MMKRRRQPFVFVVVPIFLSLLALSEIKSIESSIIDYDFDGDFMPSNLIVTDGFVSTETNIKLTNPIDNRPGKFLVFKSPDSAVILQKRMSLFNSEEYVLQFEYFSSEQSCRKDSLKLVIKLVQDAEATTVGSEKVVFDSTAMRREVDVPIPAMWREVAACFRLEGNEDYKLAISAQASKECIDGFIAIDNLKVTKITESNQPPQNCVHMSQDSNKLQESQQIDHLKSLMINRSLALALPRVFESSIQLTSQNSFFTESSTTESNNLLRNRTENPFDKPSQLYEKEYELIAFIMAGCGLFLILSGSGFIFCNWRIKKQKRLREEALARRRARKEDEIRRARRARRNENYIV